jgi:hypothetical protein
VKGRRSAIRVTLLSRVNVKLFDVLTTRPVSVQWTKVCPVLGVLSPSANGLLQMCPAADLAIGTGRAPDRNRAFLQRRDAARVPSVVGRVFETDAVEVGGG